VGNKNPKTDSKETGKAIDRPGLLNFVRKLVSEDEAEDLLQDVLTSVFSKPSLLETVENVSAYLFRALRNRATDRYREKEEPLSLDEGWDDSEEEGSFLDLVIDPRPEAPEEIIRRDLFSGLERALESLPEDDRELIQRTELSSVTIDTIALERKVPLGTLLSRKSRAMEKLRKLLDAEDLPFPFDTFRTDP
jgi:RNA polymerase sigma-70 factor (ECF subfamily)